MLWRISAGDPSNAIGLMPPQQARGGVIGCAEVDGPDRIAASCF